MIWVTSQREAAAAAKDILGCYPEIPASDPQRFAAALVKILTSYPPAVVKQATDPVLGIPGSVTFLNLAKIKEHLDVWGNEYALSEERERRRNQQLLPPPPPETEEIRARVAKGIQELADQMKRGFGPSTAG